MFTAFKKDEDSKSLTPPDSSKQLDELRLTREKLSKERAEFDKKIEQVENQISAIASKLPKISYDDIVKHIKSTERYKLIVDQINDYKSSAGFDAVDALKKLLNDSSLDINPSLSSIFDIYDLSYFCYKKAEITYHEYVNCLNTVIFTESNKLIIISAIKKAAREHKIRFATFLSAMNYLKQLFDSCPSNINIIETEPKKEHMISSREALAQYVNKSGAIELLNKSINNIIRNIPEWAELNTKLNDLPGWESLEYQSRRSPKQLYNREIRSRYCEHVDLFAARDYEFGPAALDYLVLNKASFEALISFINKHHKLLSKDKEYVSMYDSLATCLIGHANKDINPLRDIAPINLSIVESKESKDATKSCETYAEIRRNVNNCWEETHFTFWKCQSDEFLSKISRDEAWSKIVSVISEDPMIRLKYMFAFISLDWHGHRPHKIGEEIVSTILQKLSTILEDNDNSEKCIRLIKIALLFTQDSFVGSEQLLKHMAENLKQIEPPYKFLNAEREKLITHLQCLDKKRDDWYTNRKSMPYEKSKYDCIDNLVILGKHYATHYLIHCLKSDMVINPHQLREEMTILFGKKIFENESRFNTLVNFDKILQQLSNPAINKEIDVSKSAQGLFNRNESSDIECKDNKISKLSIKKSSK